MSLLNVTVKKARYVGAQAAQFNTYVTLKLQHVKSTTVTVKGANPCWEQDFLFETNDLNSGLLIEVWSKGMIWDRAMGYHLIPLESVQYANEDGSGQWVSLEAELVMRDGEVVGTKNPTGHSLLVDCRFELPFDPENTEAADLQRKLEMLNNIMDQEARAEQARRQMQYFGHSGYSEDSDYTSDLNYPVGQHANSSASQFRSAAGQMHTPTRSLETSRENSYERDDVPNHHLPPVPHVSGHRLSPGHPYGHHRHHNSSPNHHQRYSPNTEDYGYNTENAQSGYNDVADSEPLFYNSRPRNSYKQRYTSQDTWYSAEYGPSVDSVEAALGRSGYPDTGYYNTSAQSNRRNRGTAGRRPSLERQTTLYDDQFYNADNNGYYPSIEITDTREHSFNQSQSYEEYFDSSSYPYQEERYGQDEEDRQWDSGGFNSFSYGKQQPVVQENHVGKRRKSILPPTPSAPGVPRSTSYYDTAPTPRRRIPQVPVRRSTSRQGTPESTSRGASLPPTPTATPKLLARSLPPTPGRQLPRQPTRNAKTRRNQLLKRTSSADYADIEPEDAYSAYYTRPGAMSAMNTYNEDYNYAYQSIDNLSSSAQLDTVEPPPVPITTTITTTSIAAQLPPTVLVNSERRTSLTMNTEDYFYPAQSHDTEHDEYDFDLSRNKRLHSPLLQQNTDSLESRDDELKDSFETAVSSISSSFHNQYQYSEYSTAGDTLSTSTTSALPPQFDQTQPQPTATVTTMQYNRDQPTPPKQAIVSVNGASANASAVNVDSTNANTGSTAAAAAGSVMNHLGGFFSAALTAGASAVAAAASTAKGLAANNNNQQQGKPQTSQPSQYTQQTTNSSNNRGHLTKQQESIDRQSYFSHQESIDQSEYQSNYEGEYQNEYPNDYQNEYQSDYRNSYPTEYENEYREDFETQQEPEIRMNDNYVKTDATDHHYFQQESIESYTEEPDQRNGSIIDEYNGKKDSPVSVIHVEAYDADLAEKEDELSELQSQQNLIDPYHPNNQRQIDPYGTSVRRPSIDPYRPVSPSRRTSQDSRTGSRKGSLDPYQPVSRRASRISPTPQDSVDQQSPTHSIPEEEKEKNVSFEEEQMQQPRPQVTAKQRWHWAYNKIVIQLNVTRGFFSVPETVDCMTNLEILATDDATQNFIFVLLFCYYNRYFLEHEIHYIQKT